MVDQPAKRDRLATQLFMLADAVLHQSEAEDQGRGPEHQQRDQRERAEVSQKTLLPRKCPDAAGNASPRNPGAAIEPCRQLEMPGHAPRQHHRFERIQKHDADDHDAEDSRENAAVMVHARFSMMVLR